jgi:hypothetical protein
VFSTFRNCFDARASWAAKFNRGAGCGAGDTGDTGDIPASGNMRIAVRAEMSSRIVASGARIFGCEGVLPPVRGVPGSAAIGVVRLGTRFAFLGN